jgi:hypothetical protein
LKIQHGWPVKEGISEEEEDRWSFSILFISAITAISTSTRSSDNMRWQSPNHIRPYSDFSEMMSKANNRREAGRSGALQQQPNSKHRWVFSGRSDDIYHLIVAPFPLLCLTTSAFGTGS